MAVYVPHRVRPVEVKLDRASVLTIVGIAALLVLFVLGLSTWRAGGSRFLAPAPGAESGKALLAVSEMRAESRHGYVTITGQATNLSNEPLEDVEAVAELLDARGRLLRVDSALLEFRIVSPGTESPFVIYARDEPGSASYRVRFRTVQRQPIPSR